jgi:hypothetical protein
LIGAVYGRDPALRQQARRGWVVLTDAMFVVRGPDGERQVCRPVCPVAPVGAGGTAGVAGAGGVVWVTVTLLTIDGRVPGAGTATVARGKGWGGAYGTAAEDALAGAGC